MTQPNTFDAQQGLAPQRHCIAWTQDWLRNVYGKCLGRSTWPTKFGVAWRFQVQDTKRRAKVECVCLCARFSAEAFAAPAGGSGAAPVAIIRHSLVEREEQDELSS